MVNGAFVKTHLLLFSFILSFPSHLLLLDFCLNLFNSFVNVRLQPSSPGDYYSSVDSDLKLELTEKLFALDTEGNNSANTEVCEALELELSVSSSS